MPTLSSQISEIELKIKTLISENNRLKAQMGDKDQRIFELEKENNALITAFKESEDRNVALKTANAMLGSDEYKTKTKLKINSLIREIDQCIAQLT
jgi:predicted nuclease with TOPRIM domain